MRIAKIIPKAHLSFLLPEFWARYVAGWWLPTLGKGTKRIFSEKREAFCWVQLILP